MLKRGAPCTAHVGWTFFSQAANPPVRPLTTLSFGGPRDIHHKCIIRMGIFSQTPVTKSTRFSDKYPLTMSFGDGQPARLRNSVPGQTMRFVRATKDLQHQTTKRRFGATTTRSEFWTHGTIRLHICNTQHAQVPSVLLAFKEPCYGPRV